MIKIQYLPAIIHLKELINILNNNHYKENLNYHTESNPLKKEFIKMIKSITENKNKKENNKISIKKIFKSKIKDPIKNLIPPVMMKMFGIKFSQNKNLSKNLLLKNLLP